MRSAPCRFSATPRASAILAVLHDAVTPADGKPTFRKRKGRLKLRLDHHAGKPTESGV